MGLSREWIGFALALTTGVAFALANTFARLAYEGGSNPQTVAAIRFVLPTLALLVWLRVRGAAISLPGRDGWIAVGLGVVTAIYTGALLTAISEIPLALAILVFYLFPLVATLILVVFGWEKLGWLRIATILVAFAGLTLALNPQGGGSINVHGVSLALVAALGLGTVIAASSRLIRSGDSRPVTLHMAAVAGVLLIALCIISGHFALPQAPIGWVGFIGSATFYAFAMISFFIAISIIGPVRSSLLSYAEPVVTAGLGVVILGEALTPYQILGITIVIAALVGAALKR